MATVAPHGRGQTCRNFIQAPFTSDETVSQWDHCDSPWFKSAWLPSVSWKNLLGETLHYDRSHLFCLFFFPFLTASQACARSAVIWVVFKRCVSTYTHQLEKRHYLGHRSKSCFWLSVTSPLSWKFKRWHRGCLYHLTIETRKKEKK